MHLKQWFLPRDHHFVPQGHLAASGDIFVLHNGGGRGGGNATGIWWVHARDAAKHPTKHRLVSHNQELPSRVCQGAEVANAQVKESFSTPNEHNTNPNGHQAQSPSKV